MAHPLQDTSSHAQFDSRAKSHYHAQPNIDAQSNNDAQLASAFINLTIDELHVEIPNSQQRTRDLHTEAGRGISALNGQMTIDPVLEFGFEMSTKMLKMRNLSPTQDFRG